MQHIGSGRKQLGGGLSLVCHSSEGSQIFDMQLLGGKSKLGYTSAWREVKVGVYVSLEGSQSWGIRQLRGKSKLGYATAWREVGVG